MKEEIKDKLKDKGEDTGERTDQGKTISAPIPPTSPQDFPLPMAPSPLSVCPTPIRPLLLPHLPVVAATSASLPLSSG